MFNFKYKKSITFLNNMQEHWQDISIGSQHPMQLLYNADPKKFNKLLKSSNKSPFKLTKREVDEKTVIKVDYEEGVDYWREQRLYLSNNASVVANVIFENVNQTQMLEFNNVGCLGPEIQDGEAVNLFVGASELWSLSRTAPTRINLSEPVPNIVNRIEIPFYEYCTNINGSIEGANFDLILKRAKSIIENCEKNDISIKNLIIFGGWHNLIYNQTDAGYWKQCVKDLMSHGIPITFFTIPSPVLSLTFKEIESFMSDPSIVAFWGSLECTEQNYQSLRQKITEYNECLRGFADCAIIDLERELEITAGNAAQLFMDINHFSNSVKTREMLLEVIQLSLDKNRDFYLPSQGSVSEYIYPTF